MDQITWFGEPENMFAKLGGISYQECASVCDSLKECNAFTHTWNYRRYPLESDSLLFTKTRFAPLDFDGENSFAKYLAFDRETNVFFLKQANSDDDVKEQLIAFDLINKDTTNDKLKLRFWSSSGKCVSKVSTSPKIPSNNHTLSTIITHFNGTNPSCNTLGISDCSDESVLEFDLISEDKKAIQFSWSTNNDSGCIGLKRSFTEDIKPTGSDGDINVPPIVNCTISSNFKTCEYSTSSRPSMSIFPSGRPSKSSRPSISQVPSLRPSISHVPSKSDVPSDAPSDTPSNIPSYFYQCQEVQGTVCRNLPNETLDDSEYETVVTYEECKSSQTSCDDDKCTVTTTFKTEKCVYVQKTVKDLLEEMHTFFDNNCASEGSDGQVQLFSSSYSGKGCAFDNKAATFPSQEFTWSSDAVILQNTRSGKCLYSDLSLKECSETGTQWIYLFSFGHLYYVDDVNRMYCITYITQSQTTEVNKCDRKNDNQMWKYDKNEGKLIADTNSSLCLLVGAENSLSVGSCDKDLSRWSPYEECRLNTRQSTKPMKLESIKSPDVQCLAYDDDEESTLKPCTDLYEWVYVFNGDNATLALKDGTKCMGRTLGKDGLYNEIEDIVPASLPSGLVPCEEAVFSRQVLAGEEHNVFQWSLINFKTGEKTGPDYCLQAPTERIQSQCNETSVRQAQTWRAYGSAGDATEISVKPSATLQIVSDPEVLFQFYLFSKEGKSSRILRSRMAGLLRLAENFKFFLKTMIAITNESYGVVQKVSNPVAVVEEKLETGRSTFNLFNKVLIPFELVPYLGKLLKALRLRKITDMVAKHMKVCYIIIVVIVLIVLAVVLQ